MAWLLLAVVLASLSLTTIVCTEDDWERYGAPQSMELPLQMRSDAQDTFNNPTWLRYLISRQQVHPGYDLEAAATADGGFTEPRKRNNGAWVWMPAQGYVSLPKNQQAVDAAGSSGKHGKIMRYGK